MFLRASMTRVDPARIDEVIRYVEEQVVPALGEVEGHRGVGMAVNRAVGQCSVVSFWDSREALDRSAQRAGELRDDIASRIGATFEIQQAEVLERYVREQPRPGCWNRVSALDLAPDDIDAAVDAFRTSTLPALDAIDGFCAALLAADRSAGRAVVVTFWRDENALRASTERANTLRQEVRDKAHGEIAGVTENEIVIAAPFSD